MPQGKKKGRTSSKKKKGNAQRAAAGVRNSNNVPSNWQNTANSSIPINKPLLQGSTPSFQGFAQRQGLQEKLPTLYSKYKESTNRFVRFMKDNAPFEISNVNSLCMAADWMDETRFQLDPLVLRDLKRAIRYRDRVAKSVFEGGDDGHKYFLEVLVYCWSVLRNLPRGPVDRPDDKSRESIYENKFAALAEEDEDDEEDEDVFPTSPITRPEPASEPMSLDELLNSDDRNDAISFLIDLNELMGFVSGQYKVIQDNVEQYERLNSGCSKSALIEDFLEAAVATNMAIQQVQQLEMDLQAHHEHFTTPYRVLATVILPEVAHLIRTTVHEYGSKPCNAKEVIIFLGDSLECHFRNPSDSLNRTETIVQEFCKEFQVDAEGETQMENVFNAVRMLMLFEVPYFVEKKDIEERKDLELSSLGMPTLNSWIRLPYIGGGKAIHRTIRLLQNFGDIVRRTPENRQIVPIRGFFGPSPWRPGSAPKNCGDLDELLMSDILPEWVLMCRNGIVGKATLPRENEICPFLVKMRDYIQSPSNAVSWSLAFSIHALLTAILKTDCVFDQIVAISKTIFDNYFDQIDWAMGLAKQEKDFCDKQVYKHNMITVAFLGNLGFDAFNRLAIWNPLCGGTILSYICFFGNLESGCALVDCHAQLRITLHLYHAMLTTKILRRGELHLLDILYDAFKTSRGVWEGQLPQRGEMVQRFWICFGMNVVDSKRMAQNARAMIRGSQVSSPISVAQAQTLWRSRRMNAIDPAKISTAFRRICERDFRDAVDSYHTSEQRERLKGTDIYMYAVRKNDTLDAIDREQSLLALHLPCCGVLLEQFVCSFSRILSTCLLDRRPLTRQEFVVLFTQRLLAPLDFADDPLGYKYGDVTIKEGPAIFMKQFFGQLDPARALWFQASESDPEQNVVRVVAAD